MFKLSLPRIKSIFKNYGFTKFAKIKIINNMEFNDQGYMDWLLGHTFIVAYHESASGINANSIRIPRIYAKKINTIYKYYPLIDSKNEKNIFLPIKICNGDTFQSNYFYKLKDFIVEKFGKKRLDEFKITNDTWYLRFDTFEVIKDPIEIDFNNSSNFKKIKRKKF